MECQLFRICWLGYGKPAPSHKNRRFHNLQIMWTCSKEDRAPFQFRPACAPGARPSPEDRAPVSIRLFPPSVLSWSPCDGALAERGVLVTTLSIRWCASAYSIAIAPVPAAAGVAEGFETSLCYRNCIFEFDVATGGMRQGRLDRHHHA